MKFHFLIAISLLMMLSACGGGSGSSTSSTTTNTAVGSIAGTVSISNLFLSASLTSPSTTTAANNPVGSDPQDFESGEIIVEFQPGVDASSALSDLIKRYADVDLVNAGTLYPNGPYVLRTSSYNNPHLSQSAARQSTLDVVARLRKEATIKYVELNGIRHAQL